jgi:lysophospholipase L1-like esterase
VKISFKQAVYAAFSLLIGITIGLVLCELWLHHKQLGYGRIPLIADPVLHHVHEPGYQYTYNDLAGEISPHRVFYNADGLVSGSSGGSNDALEDRPFRVAFVGDSFVEASQVSYEDSFVGILEERAGERAWVRNYGVSSYSPLLELLLWRERIRSWHPTHVFLMLYDNDATDDEEYHTHAKYSETGELIGVPPEDAHRLTRYWRRLYIVRYVRALYLGHRWRLRYEAGGKDRDGHFASQSKTLNDLTLRCLDQLAEKIAASGAKLVVMAVPPRGTQKDGLSFSEFCRAWAMRRGVPYIDLVPSFSEARRRGNRVFFQHDIHFTEQGHRVVSDVLQSAFPELFGETHTVVRSGDGF